MVTPMHNDLQVWISLRFSISISCTHTVGTCSHSLRCGIRTCVSSKSTNVRTSWTNTNELLGKMPWWWRMLFIHFLQSCTNSNCKRSRNSVSKCVLHQHLICLKWISCMLNDNHIIHNVVHHPFLMLAKRDIALCRLRVDQCVKRLNSTAPHKTAIFTLTALRTCNLTFLFICLYAKTTLGKLVWIWKFHQQGCHSIIIPSAIFLKNAYRDPKFSWRGEG